MLRLAFWLTALLFVPVGLYLYFLPPTVATVLGISPLWLARVMGGLLMAWGAFQAAASLHPDSVKVGGLAGGNLLTVAAILPAVLKTGDLMPGGLRTALLLLCLLLTVFAVMGLLASPHDPRLEKRK